MIPVYKRLEHFKICINSLRRNEIAVDTVLYIFSDYAFSEKDQAAIDELRTYLKSLSGFKRIIIKEQAENKGLGNIQEAIASTLNLHPAIIYLEEDLEVSPNFLHFMNQQLIQYRDDPQVFSISGYSLPCFGGDSEQILGSTSFTAWGCGLWKEKYEALDKYFEFQSLLERLRNLRVSGSYIAKYGFSSFIQIKNKLCRNTLTPDLTIGTYLWLTNKIQLFPASSLVNTHGFDGTGWHCDATNKFTTQIKKSNYKGIEKRVFNKDDLNIANSKIIEFHGIGIKNDIKRLINNPIYYIKKFIK